jgi:hypothetical protein
MARDNVPITALTLNGMVDRGAGVTIVVANGAEIQCNGDTRGLFVEITNTNGTDRVATILKGDNPPALNAGQGDLALTIPATSGDKIISLESERFVQDDGKILIDFAASFAGVIRAFRVPKQA